jgi:hypothetical protein
LVEAFAGGSVPVSRVCRVVLVSVRWHDVQSSEVAFQRAATEALSSLVNNDKLWSFEAA